jgi:rare lipoprotein A (peptidoglycan hydrolase)
VKLLAVWFIFWLTLALLCYVVLGTIVPKLTPTLLPAARTLPLWTHGGGYYPMTITGTASWYGHREEGNRTASGEVFRREGFTAACNLLPLGTYAVVTNVQNGRRTIVLINDRGPFIDGRIIDVSEGVARHLGMHGKGLERVEVRVILGGF